METEGTEVEFLQTGMKMEIPDFIDVPSSDTTGGSKTTQVTQESTPSYVQTSDNVTYQIIDGQVVKRTSITTSQPQVIQAAGQEHEEHDMEGQENESGGLGL